MEGEMEEIEAKVNLLLDSTCEVYDKTQDPYGGLGCRLTSEIIIRAVLSSLLVLDLSTPEEIRKALQFLPRHPEYLGR